MHLFSQLPVWIQTTSDVLALIVTICTALSGILKALGAKQATAVTAAIGVDVGKIGRHLPGAQAAFEAKMGPELTQQIEDTKLAVDAANKET